MVLIGSVILGLGGIEQRLAALKAFRERVESVIIVTAEHALHDPENPFRLIRRTEAGSLILKDPFRNMVK